MLHWRAAAPGWPTRVSDLLHCPAVLAIECELAAVPALAMLDRVAAERFGTALSRDLARLVPGIESVDLVCSAALYDQAQILRPGWPVHAALADLRDRLAAGAIQASVMSIGAHAGRMPMPALEPDPRLHGSAMLLMPWLLRGERETITEITAQLERDLLDRGMAGASFALDLRDLLGFPIQHVRHMTVYDLCALTCAQYEHAGLASVWRIIENALLAGDREESTTLADGSTLHYGAGEIVSDTDDPRLRAQCRAILAAHGLALSDLADTPNATH